ncbi:MAG: TaqI-like C-terminal specificity domain-containing protein [Alcanivorax sp.]|jgi:methylase of polypeptide subunit release factors
MQKAVKLERENLESEIAAWEHSDSEKGQVYTRPEVVEFMLTAIGLNTLNDIENCRILEPSCGEGEFVTAIVSRLINLPKKRPSVKKIAPMLLAVEMVGSSLEIAKEKVADILKQRGYSLSEVSSLLSQWFLKTDFLQANISTAFTHIVGNPPYVRVENIPKGILEEYRSQFSTMTDRADLYIPFYEKGLSLLKEGGRLSFICTDRWVKNTYGKSLRKLVSDSFGLELFIDLYGIDAFEKQVMTYPAITQIIKRKCDQTVLKHETDFSQDEAKEVLIAINGGKTNLQVRSAVLNGDKPWLLGSSDQVALVHKLERQFPLLEEVGCKVFIGAATGSNKVYIVDSDHLGTVIEGDRLLPVVTASELKSGTIKWKSKYLINTYDSNGVISLEKYPKLNKYLTAHKKELCKRHVANKDIAKWYKTIDRVYEDRVIMEKLLIPDISSEPIVLYDDGKYHPNNSIYYICSESWDLHALRVILLSNITKIFISIYSTKIAKGYLRFQAQHLRRLRLPYWESLNENLQKRLIEAGKRDAQDDEFTMLACEVYQLNNEEKLIVGI